MPNPLDMVTQDDSEKLSPFDAAKMSGISIRSTNGADVASGNDPLTKMVAPVPPTDIMAIIQQVKDRLLGTGGQERYQMWPERMIRSGASLPGDVLSGAEPIIDPATGRTSERVIERTQDTAGLAGGSALIERPGAGTLGSGPVRRGMPKTDPRIDAQIATEEMRVAGKFKPENIRTPEEADAAFEAGELGSRQYERLLTQFEKQRRATLMSDTQQPGAAISGAASSAPVFYSALEHAATNAAQETMSPQQWLGYLKNQPGVKQEELNWTGIGDWLGQQKGKVKKEDVQQYLDGHKVEIKDVTKKSESKGLIDEFPDYLDEWGDTKYSSYQLPGGENYREHLLTLPGKPTAKISFDEYLKQTVPYIAAKEDLTPAGLEIMRKRYEKDGQNVVNPDVYRSSHWDEPNVLAHVRTNDRDVGGKKSLHIEEIQSDWHQQGRKRGYKDSLPKEAVEEEAKKMANGGAGAKGGWDALSDEGKEIWRKLVRNRGVPDAPFKTTWPELALKRMIRHAAENGYDRISWTPGEAQAARYDLSKQVKRVFYDPSLQGGTLAAEGMRPGSTVLDKQGIKPEQIADYIGKDAAKKLLETKRNDVGHHVLEGEDLKVGGEGMREFYDKMLPKMAEKIGKAHGVKVKQAKIGGGEIKNAEELTGHTQAEWMRMTAAERMAELERVGASFDQPVHYFDLPQSLKDHAIGKGFPLYMSGIPFPLTPVDHDPFKEKK